MECLKCYFEEADLRFYHLRINQDLFFIIKTFSFEMVTLRLIYYDTSYIKWQLYHYIINVITLH